MYARRAAWVICALQYAGYKHKFTRTYGTDTEILIKIVIFESL